MDWLDREPAERRRPERSIPTSKLSNTRKENLWQRIIRTNNQSTHQHIPAHTAQPSTQTMRRSTDRRNVNRSIDRSTTNRRAVNQRVEGAAGSLTAAPDASNRERPRIAPGPLGNHVEAPQQSQLRPSVPHSRYGNGNYHLMNRLQTDSSPHRILYSVRDIPLTLDHPRRFDLPICLQSLVTGALIILTAGLMYGFLLILVLQVVAQS